MTSFQIFARTSAPYVKIAMVIRAELIEMQDCKPRSTPCEMDISILEESNAEPVDEKYYCKKSVACYT